MTMSLSRWRLGMDIFFTKRIVGETPDVTCSSQSASLNVSLYWSLARRFERINTL